jgi:hypothetical protein
LLKVCTVIGAVSFKPACRACRLIDRRTLFMTSLFCQGLVVQHIVIFG